MGELDKLGSGDDEDEIQKRYAANIARPSMDGNQPALTLRGVPSATSSGAFPSEAPAMPAPAAKIPSALDTQTANDTAMQSQLDKGSGISQIANPYARNALRGVNVLGDVASALIPQIGTAMRAIPGTEEHHNMLVGRNQRAMGQDQAEQQAQTKTTSETNLQGAQATNQLSEAKARDNPTPKEGLTPEEVTIHDLMTGDNGQPRINPQTKQPYAYFDAYSAVKQAGQDVKPDKPKTTREITRVVNGVPHTVMVDAETGADVKDEGQTKVPGESSGDKRSAQESAQVERESRGAIRKAEEQYRGTMQSVTQLKSSIDAAKDGNGLLTSFVPTMEVLGINASNGVHRISPAEAHAAGVPGGWAEQFNAWFDKASTGKLSPQLPEDGKRLGEILAQSAYQRYQSIYKDESGIVEGYGGKDFNKRVPLIQGEGFGAGQGGGQGSAAQAGGATEGASGGKKWNPVKGVYEWRSEVKLWLRTIAEIKRTHLSQKLLQRLSLL